MIIRVEFVGMINFEETEQLTSEHACSWISSATHTRTWRDLFVKSISEITHASTSEMQFDLKLLVRQPDSHQQPLLTTLELVGAVFLHKSLP